MVVTDTAKAMATPEGQARNEEIFQAAAELMVQRGYAGTSMGDLAKAVGMTKAGLYHHISSKQDMLFQILLHAMEGLERTVIEPAKRITDPEERLREMIRLHVRGLFDHGLEFALLFPEKRHLEPAQQQVVGQQIESYLGLIRETLRELADEGKLQDLDIYIAARHILQTIAGIARWHKADTGVTEALLVEQTVNFNMSAILKNS
ncbi:TetR/AcrR family transcriptional regulator [Akkermansiaceae bacterium]|nr:TetR/AcrR family transcriptional regulator [Akkermansiaceae bacterium]MDA7646983.1 TetR/AcrR family transcriptional regulator [Akkermansiaceae bacterium]MDB4490635.1 TetR/AcrR family transcriptional regulator [bacterium]MDC0291480.1 TetR/AcrR family transcriptional regulator [Akkermansiaceae bacterium]